MGNGGSKKQDKIKRKLSNREVSPKPTISPEELAKLKKRATQRQKVVDELLSTERTYVRLLELCIIHFMIPLDPSTRGQSPSISQSFSTRSKAGSTFQRYTVDRPQKPLSVSKPVTTMSEDDMKSPSASTNNNTNNAQSQQFDTPPNNNVGSPDEPHPFPNAFKIMSQKEHRLLFSDLKMICGLNQTFLQGLEAIIDGGNWDQAKARLSDPFDKFTPFFTMYQNYLNNYDAANECYQEYSHKSDFMQFEAYTRNECEGQNLQSLIILPIQRLPRYKLLLSEILKHTESDHIDYEQLKLCLDKIAKTTKLLNERMKEYEARVQVRKIEKRFLTQINLVKPYRYLVKEGKLFKIDRTGKSVESVFVLFSDVFVYATELSSVSVGSHSSNNSHNDNESKKLKLRQLLPVDSVFSVKNIDENNGKFGNRGFEIHSSVKSFIVYASQSYEKDAWMKALNETIEKQKSVILNRVSNNEEEKEKSLQLFEAPLLIPDDYSPVCMRCQTKFTAINRRHHCRYCGFIVCGKCGKNQLASRKDKTKIVKLVCKECFEENKDKYPRPKSGAVADESDSSDDDKGGTHIKTSTMTKLRTSVFKKKG